MTTKVKARFLQIGVASEIDDVGGLTLPAAYTPTRYTPAQVGTEGTDKLSAHFKGIDTVIGLAYPYGNIQTITGNTVLSGTASAYVRCNHSADIDVTLPAATTVGQIIVVKDVTGAAKNNRITVKRSGSDTIDGDTEIVMKINRMALTFVVGESGKWEIV